jgi:hypothetical protein
VNRQQRPVRRHIRDQVIHGFDEKSVDLACEATPEIDCATIMPTTGRVIRGEVARQEVYRPSSTFSGKYKWNSHLELREFFTPFESKRSTR